jgi:hypothetical protein
VSQSFGYIPKSGIAGSNGRSMFSFLRSIQIFFQSGCTSLHSHQQCKRVPLFFKLSFTEYRCLEYSGPISILKRIILKLGSVSFASYLCPDLGSRVMRRAGNYLSIVQSAIFVLTSHRVARVCQLTVVL